EALDRCGSTEGGIVLAPDLTPIPYKTLAGLVRGNAERFAAQGVKRGDLVAIALETDLEHVVAFLALVAMGAVPVSVKPQRTPGDDYAADLARILDRFGVRRAYATLPRSAGVEPVAWDAGAVSASAPIAEVSPSDTCFVQFSSGSTSDPKPIPIRHGNLMSNLRSI